MTKVKMLAKIFESEGKQLFVVGGAVRDMVLGKEPHDFDIATDCTPEETIAIVEKNGFAIIPMTGAIEHGVVFAMVGGEQFEIASFRGDGDYTDGRHCKVSFGVSLADDLKRRDFTMNAMALNPLTEEVVDLFGGVEDINSGIIRTVGDAHDRFSEDALRVFRAARFAAQLEFKVSDNIIEAANEHIDGLHSVSGERMNTELTKLVTSKSPATGISMLRKMGVLAAVLPELDACFDCEQNNPHHMYNVGDHIVMSLEASAKRGTNAVVVAWAMLLHDIGKPSTKEKSLDGYDHFKGHAIVSEDIARNVLTRLRFSRSDMDKILFLVKNHDTHFQSLSVAKKWLGKFGPELCFMLMEVRCCDILAQHSTYMLKEKLSLVDMSKCFLADAIILNEAMSVKDLAIDGKDLLSLGMVQGPNVGTMLNDLLDMVIEDASLNTRDKLIEIAKGKL